MSTPLKNDEKKMIYRLSSFFYDINYFLNILSSLNIKNNYYVITQKHGTLISDKVIYHLIYKKNNELCSFKFDEKFNFNISNKKNFTSLTDVFEYFEISDYKSLYDSIYDSIFNIYINDINDISMATGLPEDLVKMIRTQNFDINELIQINTKNNNLNHTFLFDTKTKKIILNEIPRLNPLLPESSRLMMTGPPQNKEYTFLLNDKNEITIPDRSSIFSVHINNCSLKDFLKILLDSGYVPSILRTNSEQTIPFCIDKKTQIDNYDGYHPHFDRKKDNIIKDYPIGTYFFRPSSNKLDDAKTYTFVFKGIDNEIKQIPLCVKNKIYIMNGTNSVYPEYQFLNIKEFLEFIKKNKKIENLFLYEKNIDNHAGYYSNLNNSNDNDIKFSLVGTYFFRPSSVKINDGKLYTFVFKNTDGTILKLLLCSKNNKIYQTPDGKDLINEFSNIQDFLNTLEKKLSISLSVYDKPIKTRFKKPCIGKKKSRIRRRKSSTYRKKLKSTKKKSGKKK